MTNDYNTKIVEEFRANDGRVGGPWEGTPLILVHDIGAKSLRHADQRARAEVRLPVLDVGVDLEPPKWSMVSASSITLGALWCRGQRLVFTSSAASRASSGEGSWAP